MEAQAGCDLDAEEFLASRAQFIELHHETRWNSWVLDDRAGDVELAMAATCRRQAIVIVSSALRCCIADELAARIRQEERADAYPWRSDLRTVAA